MEPHAVYIAIQSLILKKAVQIPMKLTMWTRGQNGGASDYDNLAPSCRDCNRLKGGTPPSDPDHW